MLSALNEEQIKRYARHIVLPEVGENGQRKLLDSRVLCVGAGGLGSPVIEYLAAAGVGTLGIVDDDVVDMSNLQRQVIHAGNIGKIKAESAREFVERLNPDVDVIAYTKRLRSDNAREIIREYDFIVDASDNFETRYLINDTAVLENKPFSHGSIFRFEGHITTILPRKGPCYRCIFQEVPPPETVPPAQEVGVFGVLPGVVGSIQATEAIKYLIGIGELLVGVLLYYDAQYMEFEELLTRWRPDCPVCGENPEITDIVPENYEGIRRPR